MRCHIICQVAIAAHLSQNGDVYVDTSASGTSEVNTSFNSLGSISFKSVFLEAELALKECDSLSRPHVEDRHLRLTCSLMCAVAVLVLLLIRNSTVPLVEV